VKGDMHKDETNSPNFSPREMQEESKFGWEEDQGPRPEYLIDIFEKTGKPYNRIDI